MNEDCVYTILSDNLSIKLSVGHLVRTADKRITFSKAGTTIWNNRLYTFTQDIDDTKPSCRLKKLQDRSNEALLRKPDLTMPESEKVLKKLTLKRYTFSEITSTYISINKTTSKKKIQRVKNNLGLDTK